MRRLHRLCSYLESAGTCMSWLFVICRCYVYVEGVESCSKHCTAVPEKQIPRCDGRRWRKTMGPDVCYVWCMVMNILAFKLSVLAILTAVKYYFIHGCYAAVRNLFFKTYVRLCIIFSNYQSHGVCQHPTESEVNSFIQTVNVYIHNTLLLCLTWHVTFIWQNRYTYGVASHLQEGHIWLHKNLLVVSLDSRSNWLCKA